MAFGGIADFVALLKTELEKTGALFLEDEGARVEQNDVPRFVFVFDAIEPADRKGSARGASLGAGGTTPSLQEDAHKAIVHLWGSSRAMVEQMRGSLISVTRALLGGRNYQVPTARWFRGRADSVAQRGYRLDQELVVYLQLAERTTPATPPAAGAFDAPERAYDTVSITTLTEDASGAVAGDGELQGGEG